MNRPISTAVFLFGFLLILFLISYTFLKHILNYYVKTKKIEKWKENGDFLTGFDWHPLQSSAKLFSKKKKGESNC